MDLTGDIRRFESADFQAIEQVREQAFRPIFSSFRELVGQKLAAVAFASAEGEQAEYLKKICSPESDKEVYVYECDGLILGFCALSLDGERNTGEIDLNAVHPDYQGRGIGSEFYKFALARMRAKGMKLATVGTGGDSSHIAARCAYRKAGFETSIPSVHLYLLL